jgi:hypothetical protein
VRGGNGDSVQNALTERLAEDIEALGERDSLTVAELGEDGVVVWKVQRDQNGTPCAQSRPPVPWSSLYQDGVLSEKEFHRSTWAGSGAKVVYVAAPSADRQAEQTLDWLRYVGAGTTVYDCAVPMAEQLRDVISHDPLTRWYDLVVLRRTPSGRLALARYRLFPPGATCGDREPFTIQCERSDRHGTAFAVVSAKSNQRNFQLVSIQSAKIPPGSYDLVAELCRPGLLRFHGLPDSLREDHRSWPDLVACVPARLERIQPSHLIYLIEVSGSAEDVNSRLDRAQQLLEFLLVSVDSRLAVSVISYGAHAVEHGETDVMPQVMTWAGDLEEGMSAVQRLVKLGPAAARYTRAAQLECALAETSKRLNDDASRPILVTIGSRPPFPPRVDASEIIPCPRRHDWRIALRRLAAHPGVVFGAVHDEDLSNEPWKELGSGAIARLTHFNPSRFAVELGLTRPTEEYLPFPLTDIEEEG